MKILTVDDSKTIRRLISGIGATLGYEVLEAENGHEAFYVLGEHCKTIELILLDWNMPGMNGLEVLKIMKKNEDWRHIPVVMVTTEGERSHVVQAIQAGASHYMIKPFTQEDLSARIMECLGMADEF